MDTVNTDFLQVGMVVLEGSEFETYVSAKSAQREGVTPRPFILQEDKQRFLNKEAKETFLESHYNSDVPLHLENLSRVKTTDEEFNDTLDKLTVISTESNNSLDSEVVRADEDLKSDQKKIETPIAAVVSHPESPFNLSTAIEQARKVAGKLPTNCILIKEYDRVEREYSGNEQAYYEAGNKKSHRHQWEILKISDGKEENGVQIGELKKLWFKQSAALNEGHRLYPDLPIFKYRKGKLKKVNKVK
ncbi:hypothetical protein LIS04_24 [Listeria phage LIS04]|nr:hypothetical protein LIS04_24 [Listeria phage LIS04]